MAMSTTARSAYRIAFKINNNKRTNGSQHHQQEKCTCNMNRIEKKIALEIKCPVHKSRKMFLSLKRYQNSYLYAIIVCDC